MTGFGKAFAVTENKKICVEIKSLNSKQLDLNVRCPFYFREQEMELRQMAGRRLERGKADMMITIESLSGSSATPAAHIDVNQINSYRRQIEAACRQFGLPLPADITGSILRMPEVVHTDNSDVASDDDKAALLDAVSRALDGLMDHRRQEGRELEKFFKVRIEAIADLLTQVEPFEAERVPRIRARLEENISHIPAIEFDKGRLEQELIFYIEKLDVNEEKQRLRRHLEYFIETMEAPQPGQGKKLGFIAQEMGREINTLGSKSNHAQMQALVVRMKDVLEQIKEQVLNVM